MTNVSGSSIEGIVTAVEGRVAEVETGPRAAGCGRCQEPGGCGGGLLNLQDAGKPRLYRIHNAIEARVGDRVLLCAEAGTVLRAALLSYGLPLALLIAGAATGSAFGGDAMALAGAVFGVALGMLLLRTVARQEEPGLSLRFKSRDTQSACSERKSTT